MFTEGTRQHFGYPGPMHPGAAMVAIQEDVPIVPCGIDTFGWSPRNRRTCCVVWGDPIRLDLPRTGKGYKEGGALIEEIIVGLWRTAAQAVADGFPETLPDGSRRARTPGEPGHALVPGAAALARRGLGGRAAWALCTGLKPDRILTAT